MRSAWGKRKLRVVFPAYIPAKWKEQSIYDLMAKSDKFDPVVALTSMDNMYALTLEERRKLLAETEAWFTAKGVKCVYAYDCETGAYRPFSDFGADIVWYTQQWFIDELQMPSEVSKYALTCYTPYFVPNYGGLDMDCDMHFHRTLWRYFTLSEDWAKLYAAHQGWRRAGESVGLGHPMLDEYYLTRDEQPPRHFVIYAPHHSCNCHEHFSTFLQNGARMLALAKAHPEIDWVFKPHPSLKNALKEYNGWTTERIEAYYREW